MRNLIRQILKESRTKPAPGDTIYCHTDLIMNNSRERETTAGKSYQVISYYDAKRGFTIINDSGDSHYFMYDTYHKWFDTIDYSATEAIFNSL